MQPTVLLSMYLCGMPFSTDGDCKLWRESGTGLPMAAAEGAPLFTLLVGAAGQRQCSRRAAEQGQLPGGPEAAEEVGRLGVLVAVDDVQPLPAQRRGHLAHRGLPGARLADQQARLAVIQAPAPSRAQVDQTPHEAVL